MITPELVFTALVVVGGSLLAYSAIRVLWYFWCDHRPLAVVIIGAILFAVGIAGQMNKTTPSPPPPAPSQPSPAEPAPLASPSPPAFAR